MTQSDQTPKAEMLDDDDLDNLNGGFEAWPAKWKGFSLDGKSDSNVAGITADQKTIIGGFKSMSGMSSETELNTSSNLLGNLKS